ncbi:MAG: GGDEF domain-containing protein [Acidobacteriota bacterium]
MLPTLERGLLLALVTLLVGGLDALWLRRMVVGEIPRLIPVVLLYAGALALATLLLTRQRRLTLGPAGLAAPVLLDAAGWLLGGLSTQLALAAGWSRAVFLWPALSLLALEAARNALLRVRSDHRVGHFERLQEAHERILTETSGMGGIAQQVLVECRNILPVSWFQFELAEGDAWRSWAAGPDGFLTEGRPQPPARPGMLPGIHKRADWRLLEQPLQRAAAGGTGVGEVESDPIAVVRLWCDPRRIEEGAEELFATLVPQMASSVDRALLDQEARLDPLTGVPVRRVLEARLQIAYRRACDEGRPMSVIMCDIDFFKKVNDTHGHAAGDEALKLVAATLDSTRREDDLCCRYGGEEFTLLLERTDGDAALALAERLRQAVEALRLVYEGRDIPLALSLGVAAFPELYIKTGSELLLLADEALYEAKSRGRNQCLLHCGHGSFRPVVGAPGPERPRTEEAEGAG